LGKQGKALRANARGNFFVPEIDTELIHSPSVRGTPMDV
jgi:hypothetical protein